MAPTEVLAEQHFLGMADLIAEAGLEPAQEDPGAATGQDNLFVAAAPAGPSVRMALLTSSAAAVNFAPADATGRRTSSSGSPTAPSTSWSAPTP